MLSYRAIPITLRIAFAGGLAVAFLAGCGPSRNAGPASSSGELPDQEVSDFAVTETDQGLPQWKLFARRAEIYTARNVVVARGVRIDFYDEKSRISSTLTADEGEMQQQRRDMVARGHVVLQSSEGTRMSTEELRFLNREQKIVSDKFVRVERAGDVLTGEGFESDPQLKHFEFKRRVQAVVRTTSGGQIESRGSDR